MGSRIQILFCTLAEQKKQNKIRSQGSEVEPFDQGNDNEAKSRVVM